MEHCDIVPAIPANDPTIHTAEQLQEYLGSATYDTLLAANGAGLVLISDDWHLRNLAKTEFAVDGVWTQALLMHARSQGHVAPEAYSKAVIALAQWRYQFTSISADELIAAARRANWDPDPVFRSVARTLTLKTSDLATLLAVAVRFFRNLWCHRFTILPTQMERLTYATLDGIDPGRAPNAYLFLAGLERYARAGQLPAAAYAAVVDYYRGHFLLPWPETFPAI